MAKDKQTRKSHQAGSRGKAAPSVTLKAMVIRNSRKSQKQTGKCRKKKNTK
ncbi:hypothetical protein ACI2OX_16180 [Bacillus sp. N9]